MANIKIPQLPPLGRMAAAGDLLAGYDGVLAKTVFVDVAELPFGAGGGGGWPVTVLGSPFKVRNTDDSYAFVGADTVITDPRLLGKTDYIVSSTQNNMEFEDDQMTCDPVAGSVTLLGFQLQDGSHVSIYADGVVSASASSLYATLTAQILLLQQMVAPFATTAFGANSAKVWWIGPASDIPAGWQECTAMRGYVPIAQDPGDVYDATTNPDGLSRAIAVTGGTKYHTNSLGEMVPHNHTIATSNTRQNGSDAADPVRSTDPGSANTQGSIGTGKTIGVTGGTPDPITGIPSPAPFSMMNPYLIGIWIEFIG